MLPFLLLAAGLLLIFFEFFLPGGVAGTAGAFVVIASIIVFAMTYDSPLLIALFTVGSLATLVLLFRFAIWRIKTSDPKDGIYSSYSQEGYVASGYDKDAIGKTGTVASDLKPGGHILVDGKTHQAISQSGYIDKGKTVIVLSGQGESLIVKQSTKENQS